MKAPPHLKGGAPGSCVKGRCFPRAAGGSAADDLRNWYQGSYADVGGICLLGPLPHLSYPLPPLLPSPLRTNSSLLLLDISNTGAGISGIISVCTALGEVNSTLQSLDLGRPQIKGNQV